MRLSLLLVACACAAACGEGQRDDDGSSTGGEGASHGGAGGAPASSSSSSVSSSSSGMDPTDACAMPPAASVPSTLTGTTVGSTDHYESICAGTSGPEIIYELVAPETGSLDLTLDSRGDLGLAVFTSCGTAPVDCADLGLAGDTEELTVPVVVGQTYYVMVDGFDDPDQASFTLELAMIAPEASCEDHIDNDGDELIDCEDPTSCQTLAACEPGAGATGTTCTLNSQCTANANDPICLTEAGQGYPDGYCSQFCDLGADDCGAGAVCADVDLASGQGICFDSCVTSADCRTGYGCEDILPSTSICYPLEVCGDSADNDGDGAFDCDDPDCAADSACTAACASAPLLSLGVNTGDTTSGTPSFYGSCVLSTEPPLSRIYSFTPAQTGTLQLVLASATDQAIHARAACTDLATELGCADDEFAGIDEALDLPVTQGIPILVFVRTYDTADAGPYTLSASFL